MANLNGKNAIVTGGLGGLGSATDGAKFAIYLRW
jgi:NAD(P)-dependent dehydrogenase (short-subunit alcohol dehydrogenase family)